MPDRHHARREQARHSPRDGGPVRRLGVGFDSVHNDGLKGSTRTCHGLEQDGQLYVLYVHSDVTVWLDPPLDAEGKADGKARRVAPQELARLCPDRRLARNRHPLRDCRVIKARPLARRVWTLRGNGVMREVWLLAHRELETGSVKCLVPNAPADADKNRLVRLAMQCHFVALGFQDAKSCLGMHRYGLGGHAGRTADPVAAKA